MQAFVAPAPVRQPAPIQVLSLWLPCTTLRRLHGILMQHLLPFFPLEMCTAPVLRSVCPCHHAVDLFGVKASFFGLSLKESLPKKQEGKKGTAGQLGCPRSGVSCQEQGPQELHLQSHPHATCRMREPWPQWRGPKTHCLHLPHGSENQPEHNDTHTQP